MPLGLTKKLERTHSLSKCQVYKIITSFYQKVFQFQFVKKFYQFFFSDTFPCNISGSNNICVSESYPWKIFLIYESGDLFIYSGKKNRTKDCYLQTRKSIVVGYEKNKAYVFHLQLQKYFDPTQFFQTLFNMFRTHPNFFDHSQK